MADYDNPTDDEQDDQDDAQESQENAGDKTDLDHALGIVNVAEGMSDKELNVIAGEVYKGFTTDDESRRPWLMKAEEWMKLATQVADKKSYPWPGAANVQYPLLTTASMQFAARAYPALVPGPDLVRCEVKSRDIDGQAWDRAKRIGAHMSYQIMCEMDDWEEDMDKLVLILPIVGCAFKKTYYNPLKEQNISCLVPAERLVVNYWSKSLSSSFRKTELIYLNRNEVEERVRNGIFLHQEYGHPVPYMSVPNSKKDVTTQMIEPEDDDSTPYTFLEQHTWYDMDGDGYAEPWIITIEYTSKKVARIVPRFRQDGIKRDGKKIKSITPVEYYTKFTFIPNPDGGIYDVGFGLLLGALNHTVDSLTNMLLDAGTLSNLQAGFIGRGIRIKGGGNRFQPGEWKQADFTGDDIKKNIFPLPAAAPSDVLFKLLEALVTSSKELASVSEVATGKLPGQNTPATTTQISVDQSLKVFTAIYKRLYRSLTQEYEKLFELNKLYLPDEKIYFVLNTEQQPQEQELFKTDYKDDLQVKPNADPNVVSDAQELARAQALFEIAQSPLGGWLQPQEVLMRLLKAGKQPAIQKLINPQGPPPDPKQQETQAKVQIAQQKAQGDQQKSQADIELKKLEMQIDVMKAQLEQQQIQMEMVMKKQELEMDLHFKGQEHQMDMQHSHEQHQVDMTVAHAQGQQQIKMGEQKMQQQEEAGNLKLQQQKQQAAQKKTTQKE